MTSKYFAVFLYFLLLILLGITITWPVILHLNSYVLDPTDGLLNTWMLNWTIHSLLTFPGGIFNYYNANIFFPYKLTFAYSDLQIPIGLLMTPILLIFKEPLAVYNTSILLGLILTAYATYILSFHLSKNKYVSMFIGIMFSFSSIHLNYIAHQQVFHMWPVIFAIYFLLTKKYSRYVFFFTISSLVYVLNFYMISIITAIYVILQRKDFKDIFIYWIVGTLLTGPFLLPYEIISRANHYTRPITDVINFSLHPLDIFNIGSTTRLSTLLPHIANATPAYPGALFATLIIAFLWTVTKKRFLQKINSESKKLLFFFLILAAISFLLALGPGLHIFRRTIHVGPIPIIPMPYLIFYYLVPGFQGFRTPSRWILLTFFSLAMAIAIFLSKKKISIKYLVIFGLLVIFEVNFPFKYTEVPSLKKFPPEQIWLKDNFVGAPIIQFPIYGWWNPSASLGTSQSVKYTTGVGEETLREYYSTIHWHPMFNGYSGFSPREWEIRVQWLQKNFPSNESIDYLKNLGIKLILVPKNWYQVSLWSNRLTLIKEFPNTVIYEIK